jgi:hypothetical protein
MNRPIFVDAGERTRLLPKTLTYGFSIDFRLRLDSDDDKPPGPMVLEPGEYTTYHVSDRDFITTADGALREVPKASLTSAADFLPLTKDIANLNGRLLLSTDTVSPLVMSYSGVLNVPGGTSRWLDKNKPIRPATAYLYSRQDYVGASRSSSTSTFRPECVARGAY